MGHRRTSGPIKSSINGSIPTTVGSNLGSWQLKYSRVFGDLGSQDLTSSAVFDTVWTAAHTSAASPFNITSGAGIVCKPNDGTNWTGSSSWTGPYVWAKVSDLIGTFTKDDWLAFIVRLSFDSTALFAGAQIVDTMVNYGTTDLQNYRNETRFNITTSYGGGGHVRTYAGSQTGGTAATHSAAATALELQIRGGKVRSFFHTGGSMPSGPSIGTPNPTTGDEASIENNDPSDSTQYNVSTNRVALSAYNFNSSGRTITWQQIDIWKIDMSAFSI